MASDYIQSLSITKRLRFYDGQFIVDQDLIDEQKFHVAQMSHMRRTLQVAGVVDGLDVSLATDDAGETVVGLTVSAGSAVDSEGHLIQLADSEQVDFDSVVAGDTYWLYIYYKLAATDEQSSNEGTSDFTRWQDTPGLLLTSAALGEDNSYDPDDDGTWNDYLPSLPTPVLLATYNAYRSPRLDTSARTYSGLRLPGSPVTSTIQIGSDGNLGIYVGADGLASQRLAISQAGDLTMIADSGSVTLGAQTEDGETGLAVKIGDTERLTITDTGAFTLSTGDAELAIGSSDEGHPSLASSSGTVEIEALTTASLTVTEVIESASNQPLKLAADDDIELWAGDSASLTIDNGWGVFSFGSEDAATINLFNGTERSFIYSSSGIVEIVGLVATTTNTNALQHKDYDPESSVKRWVTLGEDGNVVVGPNTSSPEMGSVPTILNVAGHLYARNAVVTAEPEFASEERLAEPLRVVAGRVRGDGETIGSGFTVNVITFSTSTNNKGDLLDIGVAFEEPFAYPPILVATVRSSIVHQRSSLITNYLIEDPGFARIWVMPDVTQIQGNYDFSGVAVDFIAIGHLATAAAWESSSFE